MPVALSCKTCSKEFHVKPRAAHKAKFCSRKCIVREKRELKRVLFNCEICGTEFGVKQSHADRGPRFCSKKCGGFWHATNRLADRWKSIQAERIELKCCQCQAVIRKSPSLVKNRTFCGTACYMAHRRANRDLYPDPPMSGEKRFCAAGCGASVSNKKYCAAGCRYTHNGTTPTAKVNCAAGCGALVRNRKYCTPECRYTHTGTTPMVKTNCRDCGVELIFSQNYPRSRCKSCYGKTNKGAGNPNWQGGKGTANSIIRASAPYKAWRKSVFERDSYTCVHCGQIGGTLHADHIMPFSKHPDLRLELSNGRTLCLECHKKTPTYLSGALRKSKCNLDPTSKPA